MKNLMVKIIKLLTITLFLFITAVKSKLTFPQFPQNFEKITCPTELIQLSVGKNEVWGVDRDHKIYQCKITEKKFKPVTPRDRLKSISVGYDDSVWELKGNNNVWPLKKDWQRKVFWIEKNWWIGTLIQISVGKAKSQFIWGVNTKRELLYWIGGNEGWKKHNRPNNIPLKHVSCGYDGALWVIGKDDDSVWRLNKKDNKWEQIAERSSGKSLKEALGFQITLTQVDVGDKDHVVGVDKNNQAYVHDKRLPIWHTIGKGIKNISINKDGDIWLVTTKGHVYRGKFRVK